MDLTYESMLQLGQVIEPLIGCFGWSYLWQALPIALVCVQKILQGVVEAIVGLTPDLLLSPPLQSPMTGNHVARAVDLPWATRLIAALAGAICFYDDPQSRG
jgi:hypothetical protein